jgi:hypothetical protein
MIEIVTTIVVTSLLTATITSVFFLVLFKKVVAPTLDEKVEDLKVIGTTIERQVSEGVASGVKKAIRDLPAATVKETGRTVAELGVGLVEGGLTSFFGDKRR